MEKDNVHFVIYPIFVIIIILVIISIVIIWKPMFSKVDKNAINIYEDLQYEQQIRNYYTQFLNNNLKITNFDELYNKIDSLYIEKLQLNSKDEIKNYLKENSYISMNFDIVNIDVYDQGDTNYLIVTYNVRNQTKYITITETRPYVFKISFMEDYNLKDSISDFKLEGVIEDIVYSFDVVESTNSSIKFKVVINNNSKKNVVYDFSYLDSIQLIYGDNYTINMTSVANSNDSKYTLIPGSMTSVEAYYVLPYEQQLQISGAKINNASVNGVAYNVEI